MERWLPWTEMRHTNKTEISLAAMALVVTGNVSVHNHRRVYMFCRVSLAELRLDRVMVVGRVHCSVPGGEVLHILLLLLLLCPLRSLYITLYTGLYITLLYTPVCWSSTVKNPHK